MKKCIFADDSKIVTKVAQKILENLGLEVFIANNGEEVLDIYSNNKIDLLILEYNLPKIDGFDILYKIKSENLGDSSPKIIITSNQINEREIIKSLTAQADDFLIKPFDEDIIRSKLKIISLI